MAKIEIHRITNANVYLDGQGLLGRAEEVQLPTVKAKMVEHKALGMVGTIEAFAGIEKLDGKIKWASFYPDVMAKTANPFRAVRLQVRGSMAIMVGGSVSRQAPAVAQLTVAFKGLPLGTYKQHDNVELETDFTAYYVKLTVDGQAVIELDTMANIYKAGGQDLLAQYRANIGG